jgi:hypothetical protein
VNLIIEPIAGNPERVRQSQQRPVTLNQRGLPMPLKRIGVLLLLEDGPDQRGMVLRRLKPLLSQLGGNGLLGESLLPAFRGARNELASIEQIIIRSDRSVCNTSRRSSGHYATRSGPQFHRKRCA